MTVSAKDSKGSRLPSIVGDFYRSYGIMEGMRVGVAFSGGADSVALLAASRMAGIECVALHCNFHLRGSESDRDEAFARDMAARLGCAILVRHFDVAARRAQTGESVEMACRALRYRWFEEEFAAAAHGDSWRCIAVGHHADDNVETFFLNLFRGSGLKGLGGISAQRGIFLRPLLGVTRADIIGFLHENELPYVIDSSNLSNDYRRNVLRNKVLPVMEEEFPGMRSAVGVAMGNIAGDMRLLEELVARERNRVVDSAGIVDLAALGDMPHAATLLYHLVNTGGCNDYGAPMVEAMLRCADRSGRVFRSPNGRSAYLLDRGRLIPFDPAGADAPSQVNEVVVDSEIVGHGGVIETPLHLCFERVDKEDFIPRRDASVIWLDADAIGSGCLTLRRWHEGDRMRPFGLKGSRLVSDILSDAKFSILHKQNVWILCFEDKILWIPGVRTSCHFTVGKGTRNILRISCFFPHKNSPSLLAPIQ